MAPLSTLGKKISGKKLAFQSRQATEYMLQIQARSLWQSSILLVVPEKRRVKWIDLSPLLLNLAGTEHELRQL